MSAFTKVYNFCTTPRHILTHKSAISKTRVCNAHFLKTPSNNVTNHDVVDSHRKTKLSHSPEKEDEIADVQSAPSPSPEFRDLYPDFLPEPIWHRRDRICEKLEREDMFCRRVNMTIPEFYVGSVVAVTVADENAPGKTNRFVGICINRSGHGLRSNFTLRNVIDGEGIEILYDLYNPVLHQIEVLKLEKRLDPELYYLRDAPQEYSTVPLDMTPVPLPKGSVVPVNTIKVKLNPRPWHERWERRGLLGAELPPLKQKIIDNAKKQEKPWEKFDMMKEYRQQINDEDVAKIEHEVMKRKKQMENRQNYTSTLET